MPQLDREQMRLQLIPYAERLLDQCRRLALGRTVPLSEFSNRDHVDELWFETKGATDPGTLEGSLVIAREFLCDVEDAALHGHTYHDLPWRETCVCLEAILDSLRNSEPFQSQTLLEWWVKNRTPNLPLPASSVRPHPTNLPLPASGTTDHGR